MKWDESKFSDSVDSIKRRIDDNPDAQAQWQRYWETHCAKRWVTKTIPTMSYCKGGPRSGRPVVEYYPVAPVDPIRLCVLKAAK